MNDLQITHLVNELRSPMFFTLYCTLNQICCQQGQSNFLIASSDTKLLHLFCRIFDSTVVYGSSLRHSPCLQNSSFKIQLDYPVMKYLRLTCVTQFSIDYTTQQHISSQLYNSNSAHKKSNQTICIDQTVDLGRFIINFKVK